MRTVLTLAVLSLCGALGDLYLAKGMQQVGALPTLRLRALLVFGRTMARTGAVRLGVLCLIVNCVTLVVALSWAEVSFLVPATALHFVLATLGAKWLLGTFEN
jgi:bacterial/archaeal transporter family protein